MTSSPTRCSQLGLRLANACGISKLLNTICGIAIFPRPPNLVTVKRGNKLVDAVAQIRKPVLCLFSTA